MRFKIETKRPEYMEEKKCTKFFWFPTIIGTEFVWFETVTVLCIYYDKWIPVKIIDNSKKCK